jgi:hypothetical protein
METEVEAAPRHVAEGEVRVELQREIVAEMERDGHPAALLAARKVLGTLLKTLDLMRQDLERKIAATGGAPGPQ